MDLALFDLDHTLLDGDSNTLWLDFLVEHGHVTAALRARQADLLAGYAAETLDIEKYLAFHLGLLAHRPLDEWLAPRTRFVAACIAPRISDAARAAIEHHRSRGDRLAIVTATHHFLAAAIGELFDLPVIAPRGEIVAGRLSGRVAGPLCFRERKIGCVEDWLAGQGIARATIGARHFYSDSINDLPLLKAVDHPVAVNADARLAAVASQRGWPMRTWRCDPGH